MTDPVPQGPQGWPAPGALSPPPPPKNNSTTVVILTAVIVLLLLGGGAYLLVNRNSATAPSETGALPATTAASSDDLSTTSTGTDRSDQADTPRNMSDYLRSPCNVGYDHPAPGLTETPVLIQPFAVTLGRPFDYSIYDNSSPTEDSGETQHCWLGVSADLKAHLVAQMTRDLAVDYSLDSADTTTSSIYWERRADASSSYPMEVSVEVGKPLTITGGTGSGAVSVDWIDRKYASTGVVTTTSGGETRATGGDTTTTGDETTTSAPAVGGAPVGADNLPASVPVPTFGTLAMSNPGVGSDVIDIWSGVTATDVQGYFSTLGSAGWSCKSDQAPVVCTQGASTLSVTVSGGTMTLVYESK